MSAGCDAARHELVMLGPGAAVLARSTRLGWDTGLCGSGDRLTRPDGPRAQSKPWTSHEVLSFFRLTRRWRRAVY